MYTAYNWIYHIHRVITNQRSYTLYNIEIISILITRISNTNSLNIQYIGTFTSNNVCS